MKLKIYQVDAFTNTLSEDDVCSPSYNEDTYESNVEGLYLAGVICGGMNTHRLFIENSRIHAANIIKHISSKTNLLGN